MMNWPTESLGYTKGDELDNDLMISRGQSWEGVELCILVQSPELNWVRERQVYVIIFS